MTNGGPGSYGSDDIARDREGNPILDRYGRPVRRRPSGGTPAPRRRMPRREASSPEQQSADRPRQYIPPRPAQRSPQQRYGAPEGAQRPYAPRQRPATYQQPAYARQNIAPPAGIPPAGNPPAGAPPRGPRRRRSRPSGFPLRPRGCLGSFAFLLVALLVLTVVAFIWSDTKLSRVEALPAQQVAKTSGTNWLLVGSDSRQGLSQAEIDKLKTGGDIGIGRTDTIMLLHIPRSGQPTLLSIPRDSYVSIPGYGKDKINSAFTFGGPQLLTQTVEQATGLHVDHYAEVGFGGFSGMVDAVGGVEICVEEPIDDGVINLHLQQGCQKMDGPTALSFVRTRATPMGDLDRVKHQRQFFAALMDKATSPTTMLNPFRSIPLIAKTGSTFIVGKGDHSWDLARLALSIRGGVKTETVPVGGFADYDVGSVVLWDQAAAEALFSSLR